MARSSLLATGKIRNESPVWQYFRRPDTGGAGGSRRRTRCRMCGKELSFDRRNGTTSHLKRHLATRWCQQHQHRHYSRHLLLAHQQAEHVVNMLLRHQANPADVLAAAAGPQDEHEHHLLPVAQPEARQLLHYSAAAGEDRSILSQVQAFDNLITSGLIILDDHGDGSEAAAGSAHEHCYLRNNNVPQEPTC